jgi:hypothetical protein
MTDSSTENGVLSSEGGETTAKTTTISAEEATVEESASDLAPQAPSESSPVEGDKEEDNDDGGDQTDVTEADSEKKEEKDVEKTKDADALAKSSTPAGPATATDKAESDGDVDQNKEDDKGSKQENQSLASGPVVSSTKRTRPAYKYDPEKVTLRFLFANKDGLTVTVECKPGDTVGEVKGQLLSVWPKGEWMSCNF